MRSVTIGPATLYLANCHEVMAHLPDELACVADPPYGVPIMTDFDFQRKGQVKKEGRAGAGKKFDAVIGNDEEFDPTPFMRFKEVIIWGSNHYAHRLPHNGRALVWDKRCGVIPERTQADGEMAWCKEYGAMRIFRHIWDGMVKDSERGVPRVHPTQKPVALMEWCLKFTTCGLVFDPFMGSGTTGVACVRAGRKFIGCELSEQYFDAACKRIEAAVNSPDIFAPPAAKPTQTSLL